MWYNVIIYCDTIKYTVSCFMILYHILLQCYIIWYNIIFIIIYYDIILLFINLTHYILYYTILFSIKGWIIVFYSSILINLVSWYIVWKHIIWLLYNIVSFDIEYCVKPLQYPISKIIISDFLIDIWSHKGDVL